MVACVRDGLYGGNACRLAASDGTRARLMQDGPSPVHFLINPIPSEVVVSGERREPVGVEAYRGFYEVSDLGRVRRSVPGKGTRPGKILTPTIAIRNHP